MKHVEPPSPEPSTRIPLFMIGKDSRGHWVVQDQQGICGGLSRQARRSTQVRNV